MVLYLSCFGPDWPPFAPATWCTCAPPPSLSAAGELVLRCGWLFLIDRRKRGCSLLSGCSPFLQWRLAFVFRFARHPLDAVFRNPFVFIFHYTDVLDILYSSFNKCPYYLQSVRRAASPSYCLCSEPGVCNTVHHPQVKGNDMNSART